MLAIQRFQPGQSIENSLFHHAHKRVIMRAVVPDDLFGLAGLIIQGLHGRAGDHLIMDQVLKKQGARRNPRNVQHGIKRA